jgi:hypothetical protein
MMRNGWATFLSFGSVKHYFKMEKGKKKDPKYYHPSCDPVTSPSEFFVHFK